MKNYIGAKEWLEKAMTNGGESMPTLLEHYGDILFKLNDKEQALLYWQKAQEKGSSSELLYKKITNKQLFE